MSFNFPYQYGLINGLKIPYPIVIVTLNTIRGKRDYSFIMDTGADTMTLPNFMLTLLKINQKSLKQGKSQGIGKTLVNIWEGEITIIFCKQTLNVNCCFTDNDETPFLLGKDGIFNHFNVFFDNHKKETIFNLF